jgi:hypothetical protein
MTKCGYATLVAVVCLFVSCASTPASAPPTAEAAPAAPSAQGDQAPAKSASRERAEEMVTGDKTPAASTKTASKTGNETTTPASSKAAPAATVSSSASDEEPAVAAGLSAKEKQFMEGYLKRLKYMMVMKEGVPLDEFQKRMILTKGNEQLLKQGFDVVHYDQLQKNMEDQRAAYEAEAGESMSLTQFIAQKLGADVYVELDSVPRSWSDGGKHYGEANFTANMFDPSTAELLGSVTYRTDRSLSTSSQEDALLNALTAGTAQFMPRVVRDSTSVLRNRNANGVRYQVILQKTPDSRAVSVFRRNLRSSVREIVMGASAADQTAMDVYLFDSIGVLEDACYAAFKKTPGMENAYWVYTRGKTITFNSGL